MTYYRPNDPVPSAESAVRPVSSIHCQYDGRTPRHAGRPRPARSKLFVRITAQYTVWEPARLQHGPMGTAPFTSNWAEVAYFLQPNIGQTANGTVQLYTLYRRQKLLVEPNPSAPSQMAANDQRPDPANSSYPFRTYPRFVSGETDKDFPDVSSWYNAKPITPTSPSPYAFNGPSEVTEPVRRWGMNLAGWTTSNPPPAYGQPQTNPAIIPQPFNTVLADAAGNYGDARLGQRIGGDVLLTDVVNFEIKVLWEPVRGCAEYGQVLSSAHAG